MHSAELLRSRVGASSSGGGQCPDGGGQCSSGPYGVLRNRHKKAFVRLYQGFRYGRPIHACLRTRNVITAAEWRTDRCRKGRRGKRKRKRIGKTQEEEERDEE